MLQDAPTAWHFVPGFDAAAIALAVFGVYVALELARRLDHTRGRTAALWLAGSALAFATAMAAAHFVAFAARPLPFPLGYGGWVTAVSGVCSVVAAALALGLATRPEVLPKTAAALVLAAAAVAASAAYLVDLRIAPALEWRPTTLAAAVVLLAAALGAAAALLHLLRRQAMAARIAASAIVGLALFASDRLTTLSAVVRGEAVSLNHLVGVGDLTLSTLAGLGGGALLSVLLLLSVIEARMSAALRAAVARIDEAGRTDPLTRLPNRNHFDQHLDAAARQADAHRETLALLFIGLDGFKTVNDSFGRRVGDLLLQETAGRLRATCDDALIARAGGDEFVMLIAAPSGGSDAALASQRLLAAFAEPFDLEGRHAPVTCSIGVVLYPRDGNSSGAMARAEAAARFAKRNGGATFAFFEPHMLGDAREQVELLRDLRQAVARRQLELFYQPKVHAPSGEITGAEALLRWNHPQRGMVSPAVFVPIAERHGLINTLGQWVIEEACRQARAWRDQGLRMRVAINLSVHQLRQPDLADRIDAALKAHQVNPRLLTCEITESVAMEDAEGTRRIFERLAAVGVHLSIDDFGTGYCNFAMLRKLPAEELKIDRSFVLDLETSPDARAVVDAVVKLAQALGRKVVAEGVETEAQHQVLRSLGCDELQGYLFAKPMSAKALALWAMSDVGPRPLNFRDSLFTETLPAPLH